MKKAQDSDLEEMRREYDFSQGVKNRYAQLFAEGSHVVMIRPEIFAAFPSEEAVNAALETLIRDGAVAKTL